MKKIIKFILSLIMFACAFKIYAYEIVYSEWSEEYPENIGNKRIEKEDRYLWYVPKQVDEKYLVKEKIGNRIVDYTDFKLSEKIDSKYVEPEKLEDRIIEIEEEKSEYNKDELIGIIIEDVYKNSSISEIEILDSNSLEMIEIKKISDNSLIDNDFDNYISIKDKISIYFKDYKSIDNIIIKIYCKNNSESYINFSLISYDEHPIYSNNYNLNSDVIVVNKNDLKEDIIKITNHYFYTDKLYRTYVMADEKTDDYLKECEGCRRIDNSKKTFYRYIKNDYVIISQDGEILEDDSSCIKIFCMLEYLEYKEPEEKKEEPKEEKIIKNENPKTYDDVEKYIILLLISLFLLILLLFHKKIILFLSNRFKRFNKNINI